MSAAADTKHIIKWYVYTGGTNADGTREKIRRTATMRGMWPGYDVECSCGQKSRTGGAVLSYMRFEVEMHTKYGSDL